jgi:hypothetical protein
MPAPTSARDVFINCPFDPTYKPFFWAIVFTALRSGFVPRCALEADDSSENRLAKIQAIIEECRFGIHDISRTEVDGDPPLPRFNMALELGLFLGAKRYGNKDQKSKRALVLDREPYRYQRFISDIAGADIHSHGTDPGKCIEQVATWLRTQSRDPKVPGGRKIAEEFEVFQSQLDAICEARGLEPDELTFGDFGVLVEAYLTEEP